jgi:sulfur-oxidizing protein SoxX
MVNYQVVGDSIVMPLSVGPPDPSKGRQIVLDRRVGNCLICHRVPEPGEPSQGDLGPDLAGVGKRLMPGQLRLRLVDQRRLNAATVMPPYHRIDGLRLVGASYVGRPVLTASQIEDVVAYLGTLRD